MPTIFVSSGVTSTGLTISPGSILDVLSGGTAVDTHILNGGLETVEPGAIDSATVVSSGGVLSMTQSGFRVAQAIADSILAGGTAIVGSAGWLQSATVRGVVLVDKAGLSQFGKVLSGGLVTVLSGGDAISMVVSSGGEIKIGVSGIGDTLTVSNGGTVTVQSGGSAFNLSIANGGEETVSAGGLDAGTQVSYGGLQIVSGVATFGFVLSGGFQFVDSGGTTSGMVVSSGGTEQVASGGTAVLLAGETAYGLEAEGGRIIVSSGGTAVSPTIDGGRLELRAGASVQGPVSFNSFPDGVLRIDGTMMPNNTMKDLTLDDAFDLRDIAFNPAGSATLTLGNVLQVNENGSTYNLNLDPVQSFAGRVFTLSGDGNGGTRLTEVGTTEDFDGDKRSDLLLHNAVSGSFVNWTMSGTAIAAAQNLTFNGSPVALDSSWAIGGVGDFDGDGRADILLHNSGNGLFVDWTMSGSAIIKAANLTYGGSAVALDPSWSIAAVDGFSGYIGTTDILLRNSNGTFVDWTMLGSKIFGAFNVTFNNTAVALDSSWSIAATGDFNGDSRADILLRNNIYGSFVDWTMDQSIIVSADNLTFNGAAVALDNSWQVLGAGDLNGGGKADILLRGSDGSFIDWTMNGSNITSADNIVFQGNPVKIDSSWTFADIADYNGDGRRDILLRNTNGSFVAWTMNGPTITSAGSVTFQGSPVTLDSSWQTV